MILPQGKSTCYWKQFKWVVWFCLIWIDLPSVEYLGMGAASLEEQLHLWNKSETHKKCLWSCLLSTSLALSLYMNYTWVQRDNSRDNTWPLFDSKLQIPKFSIKDDRWVLRVGRKWRRKKGRDNKQILEGRIE